MYGDPQQQQQGGDFHRGPPMRQPSASSINIQPDYVHSNTPPLPPAPYEGNTRKKKKNEDFSHFLLVLYFEDGEFDDIHNLGFSNV